MTQPLPPDFSDITQPDTVIPATSEAGSVPEAQSPAPDAGAGIVPGEVTGPAAAVPVQSASNLSPVMAPSAASSAARAHGILRHLITAAEAVMRDIERYVPADVLSAGRTEADVVMRRILP